LRTSGAERLERDVLQKTYHKMAALDSKRFESMPTIVERRA
jgi:hypothetical protein